MNQVRKAAQSLKGKLPLAASVAIGISLFLFFLSIFADGNPVVASVRTAMNELAVRYLSWLLPSREMFIHFLLWVLGSLSFGIQMCIRDRCAAKARVIQRMRKQKDRRRRRSSAHSRPPAEDM